MTFGESPFGVIPGSIIQNIIAGKADFSKLVKTNPLVGFRWLEALNLIKWMTKTDHSKRPSLDQVINDIFFKNAEERKTILIAANDILNNPSADVKDKANLVVTNEIVPTIKAMQKYLPEAKIPSFENWNTLLSSKYMEAMCHSKTGEHKYGYKDLGQLLRMIRNTLAHFSEIVAKNGVKKALGGDTLEDFIQYINDKFPWLLIFAQTIIDRA